MSRRALPMLSLIVLSVALIALAIAAGRTTPAKAWVQCGQPLPASAFPIKVYVNPAGGDDPTLPYAVLSATLDQALQEWTDLPDSNISFVRVSSWQQANVIVRLSSVLYSDDFAVAESWCPSPGFQQDMVIRYLYANWDLNPNDGADPNKKLLLHVLRHEVGHILGLQHSCVTPTAIMCTIPNFGAPLGANWPIDPDAQAAMAQFYPQSGAPSSTPTPTATPTASPTPSPTPADVCREAYFRNGVLAQGAIRACP